MAIYVNVIGKNQRVVSLKNYVPEIGHLYCGDIAFLGFAMDLNSGEEFLSFTSKYLPVSSDLGPITKSQNDFVHNGVTYYTPVYSIPCTYEFSESPEDFTITVDENIVNSTFPDMPSVLKIRSSYLRLDNFWLNSIIYIAGHDSTSVNIISKYKITNIESEGNINVKETMYSQKYAMTSVSWSGEMPDITLILDVNQIMSNWEEFCNNYGEE